jgi:hypothetical protein
MKNSAPFRRVSWLLLVIGALTALPSHADGPLHYYTLPPCRLADTRNAPGLNGGPVLASLQERAFQVQGRCGVPTDAKAVLLNVTAVSATGGGFLTLYPNDIPNPNISNLNFAAGEPAIANSATVTLANSSTNPNDMKIFAYAGTGTVHVILDVAGFFR